MDSLLTLQSFCSCLFPVGRVAVEDGGSQGVEFVVSDIQAEVDDVSEHFVETSWQRVNICVTDC